MELFAAMTLTTSLSITVNVKRGSLAKTVKVKCYKTHFCHSLLLDFHTHPLSYIYKWLFSCNGQLETRKIAPQNIVSSVPPSGNRIHTRQDRRLETRRGSVGRIVL